MAELVPYPLAALARRMLRELDAQDSVFGLPRARWFTGDPDRDLAVRFHGRRASSPLGPAAGPHTQMAQNIVLSWIAGCRVMELKTVQVKDDLVIPRPCIDMATVGYNVEWSQELRVEQSLEEYVKAAMLVEMLRASGKVPLAPGYGDVVYDMSVGYDLAGIQSPKVRAFIEGMMDAGPQVARLRAELPRELGPLRDLDFPTRLSGSLTLSTFHGCPPDEIERIIDWLQHTYALDCVVKLNPTLLGKEDGRALLRDVLGYRELSVPDAAYDDDTGWEQMVAFAGRLGDTADRLGLGFGLKLTNTQIVENHRDFFPASERLMYLSGPPLHVLAVELARRVRAVFGDRFPISFSAGIDRRNFPDAVALGLVPITVCSDLLQQGGYGRAESYFRHLATRMDAVGARDVEGFTLRAYGLAAEALDRAAPPDPETRARCLEALEAGADLRAAAGEALHRRWLGEARVLNAGRYAAETKADPRYQQARNAKPPRKVASHLVLLDCLTCDKCLPVCPNHANFTFPLPPGALPTWVAWKEGGAWAGEAGPPVRVEKDRQIGNFVDFCNDCGNCDVFCPELDGPYRMKARFHGSLDRWRAEADRDGLFLDADTAWARVDGREVSVARAGERLRYRGDGFDVSFHPEDPLGTLGGEARGRVDLGLALLVDAIRAAVLAPGEVSYPEELARAGARAAGPRGGS